MSHYHLTEVSSCLTEVGREWPSVTLKLAPEARCLIEVGPDARSLAEVGPCCSLACSWLKRKRADPRSWPTGRCPSGRRRGCCCCCRFQMDLSNWPAAIPLSALVVQGAVRG